MSKPSDIVTIALAEVGYREKASNANLDDKTANSGAANWTKYARDLAAAGYYNGNKNGYAWCDVFVDWCFFKAYGAVEGQRIQCQSRSELAVSSPRSTTSRKGGMTATRKSVIRCSFSPAARSVTLESWSKSPTLPS